MAEEGIDPITKAVAEIRFVQPYQATKWYLCPGCNTEIPPGTGHFVVVPIDNVELRRHWHRRCLTWEVNHGQI
ncbi:hypothetical protein [Ferrimicrobium sp.]|uniref:hypothetical protein n=1 Tax=Ferrimicrobium sp. TaxID=2926050 RepID=UPI00260D6D4E|nr:hypothetical protein [Ferrimicrobium sp.]